MPKEVFGLARATAAHEAERRGLAPGVTFAANAPAIDAAPSPVFSSEQLAEAVGLNVTDLSAVVGRLWEIVQPVFSAQREAQWLLSRRAKLLPKAASEEAQRVELENIESRLRELQRVAAYSAPSLTGIARAIFAAQQERLVTFSAGAVMMDLHNAKDAWADNANLPVTLRDWQLALNMPGATSAALLEKIRSLNAELLQRVAKQTETFSVRLSAARERLEEAGCDARDALAAAALCSYTGVILKK